MRVIRVNFFWVFNGVQTSKFQVDTTFVSFTPRFSAAFPDSVPSLKIQWSSTGLKGQGLMQMFVPGSPHDKTEISLYEKKAN